MDLDVSQSINHGRASARPTLRRLLASRVKKKKEVSCQQSECREAKQCVVRVTLQASRFRLVRELRDLYAVETTV